MKEGSFRWLRLLLLRVRRESVSAWAVVAAIATDDGPRRKCMSGEGSGGLDARQDGAAVIGSVASLALGAVAVGNIVETKRGAILSG